MRDSMAIPLQEGEILPNALRRKQDPLWRAGFSLGVDLGLSRTGIALSKGFSVRPLTVLNLRGQKLELRLVEIAEEEIARFKRQKAAESKLLEIKERRERRGRSTRAASLSTPVEAGEEDVLDDDGKEEREAWLTTISLAICKTLDLIDMLKKEEEMLSAVRERQSQV